MNLGPIVPPPPPISVSGPSWFIRIEQSDTKRSSAAYTLQDGLVVDITSRNWTVPIPVFIPTDSAALRCRNVDRQLNPWFPLANLYDFTLPEDLRQPGRR